MKSSHSLKPPTPTLNLTPMIDVVFLLIIFFIVSSSLIQQEVSMEMDLSTAETGKTIEQSEQRKLIINIPDENSLYLGMQPITTAALRDELRREVNDSKNRNGIEVRIRTSKTVPYRKIEPILRDCAEAGLWRFAFAVTPDG